MPAAWIAAAALLAAASGAAPPDWFLTAGELLQASGGALNRSGTLVHDWSPNSSVTPLMNGDRVMSQLFEELTGTARGDYIHASFWEIDGQVMLRPDSNQPVASANTSLDAVLFGAMDRGVHVRLLISSNSFQQAAALSACRKYNARCTGGYCCAPDGRHANAGIGGGSGSNHEKIWTVQRRGELVALVGSMDIADDRWDTAQHDPRDPNRTIQPQDPVRRFPWHGDMYLLRGAAAADVERTFWQRWNDPVSPYPLFGRPPPYRFSAAVPAAPGAEAVQVVRTFGCDRSGPPCWGGCYGDFAPKGEYSYAALFYKALARARQYIYLADQFMWFDEAMLAVAEALPNVQAVVIVTDMAVQTLPVGALGHINLTEYTDTVQHYQYQALKPLLESPHADKVKIFSLGLPGSHRDADHQIYVHSKTLIIDDEFGLVGSCGIERAGFTNDAELSIGVVSPGVPAGPSTFAGRLRRQVWGEFLELEPEATVLVDPIEAVKEWVRQADAGGRRVRHYSPRNQPHWYSKSIYEFVEPDGRCSRKATTEANSTNLSEF